MPSMLDPHVAMIEGWLAAEPQLTALAILGRLSERQPGEFGPPQHSIVQRLLKALRKKAAEKLVAEAAGAATVTTPLPGAVDGSGCIGPDPPTAPTAVLAAKAGMIDQSDDGRSALSGNILR
jgi:hypothetical protein